MAEFKCGHPSTEANSYKDGADQFGRTRFRCKICAAERRRSKGLNPRPVKAEMPKPLCTVCGTPRNDTRPSRTGMCRSCYHESGLSGTFFNGREGASMEVDFPRGSRNLLRALWREHSNRLEAIAMTGTGNVYRVRP